MVHMPLNLFLLITCNLLYPKPLPPPPNLCIVLATEHSLLWEVWLHGWSPVLQAGIQLLHYIQITTCLLFWPNPVWFNCRPSIQWSFPPAVSVLWPKLSKSQLPWPKRMFDGGVALVGNMLKGIWCTKVERFLLLVGNQIVVTRCK